MTDKPPPDYTTMSGAEFRRAVGDDPKLWATAFVQRAEKDGPGLSVDTVADWFRGAMDAAVWARGGLLDWDKPDEHDPAR